MQISNEIWYMDAQNDFAYLNTDLSAITAPQNLKVYKFAENLRVKALSLEHIQSLT